MAALVSRHYAGAAKNRHEKMRRAITSVINQSYKNWELLICCDGCKEAYEIGLEFAQHDKTQRIKVFLLQSTPLWSGYPRNYGKFRASGDYVCYLDADDYFGEQHLEKINKGLTANVEEMVDWAWFNDYQWHPIKRKWLENYCYIERMGKCGTSNIVLRRELDVSWPLKSNYGFDDFQFIMQLRQYYAASFYRIITPEYYVCHVPPNIHGRGYDI